MKVEYVLLSGGRSTAYLDEGEGDLRTGLDRYSGQQVSVYWDPDESEWYQVTWAGH